MARFLSLVACLILACFCSQALADTPLVWIENNIDNTHYATYEAACHGYDSEVESSFGVNYTVVFQAAIPYGDPISDQYRRFCRYHVTSTLYNYDSTTESSDVIKVLKCGTANKVNYTADAYNACVASPPECTASQMLVNGACVDNQPPSCPALKKSVNGICVTDNAAVAAAKAAADAAANNAAKEAAAAAAAAAKAASDKAAADAAAKAAADAAANQAAADAAAKQAAADADAADSGKTPEQKASSAGAASAATAAAAQAAATAAQAASTAAQSAADAAQKAGAAASASAGAGPGTGCSAGDSCVYEQELHNYCAEHPKAEMCRERPDRNASATCNADGTVTVTCEGDAIDCSVYREQVKRNCEFFKSDSVLTQNYDELKSPVTNSSGSPKNPNVVNLPTALNASGGTFSASCFIDQTASFNGTSFTIPISKYCPYFEALGYLFLSLSYLIALRILGGSV